MNRSHWIAALSFLGCLSVGVAASAQPIALNTGFMPDPQRLGGVSGGPVQASNVQSNCRGFIPVRPQHILTSPTGFSFLRIFAEASGDTTIMVRSTQMTWCADDTYGINPGLDLNNLPPGRYDIYVGSYGGGQQIPYSLAITELQGVTPGQGGNVPPPVVQPQQPPPVYGNPQGSLGGLSANFPPLFGRATLPPRPGATSMAAGRTGGAVPGSGVRGEGTCRGYYMGPPNHVVLVPTPQAFLRIYALSAADSTLIVRRPDGSVVCNDDRYNFNPGIDMNGQPGLYQVWVGSYQANEARPYRLTITSNPGNEPRL
ncbi:MAG: hypothetical protein JNK72_05280 [Myxococcales bacterium]|nr:hypothetical protein [Myxococcales bacterium]